METVEMISISITSKGGAVSRSSKHKKTMKLQISPQGVAKDVWTR